MANDVSFPGFTPGTILDFAERSTDCTISGTSSGTATTVITGNPVFYSGNTRVLLEFWVPYFNCDATHEGVIEFFKDGSTIGRANVAQDYATHCHVTDLDTPAAGWHTFSVRAWRTGSDRTMSMGPTSGLGVDTSNGWYKITVVPH